MSKQEFLEKLRLALNGRVSAGIVTENVRYYEDYINTEIRKGRSEEEVLAQLGDPRLIARTIIQTNGGSQIGGRAADMSGNTRVYSGDRTDGYGEKPDNRGRQRSFGFRMPGWLFVIVSTVIFFVILALLLTLFVSVLTIVLPIILIICAVSFVVKLFRDWVN